MADDASARAVADEVRGIENALDALLTAAEQADREPLATTLASTYRVHSLADLAKYVRTTTEAQRVAEDLIENPVGHACRMAIRALGERLYEIGGLKAMERACDTVADRDGGRRWHWRSAIMDKRWDGIGHGLITGEWVA